MRLENYYYRCLGCETDGDRHAVFSLQLLQDCDVYRGHFPGKPVCPGVFNLQMVKECVQRVAGGKLKIASIKLCRLTSVATPSESPCLTLDVKFTAPSQVEARLSAGGKPVMSMQCTMTGPE